MIGVDTEAGRVLLHLTRRRHDVLLRCRDAFALVEHLRHKSAAAVLQAAAPDGGKPWGCRVESYDGYVALRFDPPEAGAPTRVPLPPDTALRLADLVEFKAQQAQYRMRFEFRSGRRRRRSRT